ncbi:elongation factor G [Acidaminococcus sp. NSJ-142]|uniref:elongation factor G n=1 Tax=Acidaminococcus TaxID=904 RepID=UPI000CF8F79B|nr:elongation factor G [Acidaminococcus provencensis]MCD2435017.1 elongation factor G [Acidaminococcus hominis]MCH4096258.1 elongation factor G [Acidaminococcus provencensis]
MKEYTGDKIRNVAIVGHGGAGTTSLTEALLYRSGSISRMCKVEDGQTTTDFEPEEIKRGVSVSATLAPVEWRDVKINFIDTPGFADFVAEVKGAFRAVDSVLIVVSATSGVQIGTEQCWKLAEEAGLPRLIFVNKMDRENADYDNILNNLRAKIGKEVLPLELPLGKEENFCGVIDVFNMKAYRGNGNGADEIEVPDDMKAWVEDAHSKMVEAAVEADDAVMERYLNGEDISDEDIMRCLVKGIRQGMIFPVLCGSAYKNIGLGRCLNAVVDYTFPAILNDFIVKDVKTGEEEIKDSNAAMAALVFKTTSDPFVGRLSFVRVFSSTIKKDSTVYNASREENEKVTGIFTLRGKTQIPMDQIVAGDIGVLSRLQFTATGDTLSDPNVPVLFPPIDFPLPMYSRAIYPKKKGDEDKIASALTKMTEEDPTIIVSRNPVTKETLISGMGDQHLEIIMERMQRKFGVEADLKAPIVEYRETIRGSADAESKYKKQTGGHGQYGHVVIKMEPLPPGSGFVFEDKIFGGAIPHQYIPAVEKGMKESMKHGILAGYPVVDLKISLLDGSYHTVDSSEMAFKVASHQAFQKAAEQAKPVLMEPYYNLNVYCDERMTGDVISDLNGKRGRILGMQTLEDGRACVNAQAPYAEVLDYAVDLRALTQGTGSFEMKFDHYEDVPPKLAEKIIAESKQEKA